MAGAALVLGAALLQAGCGLDIDGFGFPRHPAARVAGLPDAPWQALPVGEAATRDTIQPDAMEFCRKDPCGFDAAVAVFTATGAEAGTLERTLADPGRLRALVESRDRLPPPKPPRGVKPRPRVTASVTVSPLPVEGWQGLRLALAGGARQADGAVLARRQGDTLLAIVVVADTAQRAEGLAEAAASGSTAAD